jgi:predicted Zn-dependent protease
MEKLASLGYVGLQRSAGASAGATGIDPKDEIARANEILRALALIAEGKPENAAGTLRTFQGSNSKMYLAQYAMGVAMAQQQQCSKATEYLHQAVALMPDSAWAHYEMGSCLVKTGNYKSAIIHLQIASKRLSGFPQAQALLAQAEKQLRGSNEAKHDSTKPDANQ